MGLEIKNLEPKHAVELRRLRGQLLPNHDAIANARNHNTVSTAGWFREFVVELWLLENYEVLMGL